MATPLGYQALIDRFRLKVPEPLKVFGLSDKSGVMSTFTSADGSERVTLPKHRYSGNPDSIVDQLTFALKRETLNPTVLGALFEQGEAVYTVREWLRVSPSSAYARTAAFLAKWLNGVSFDFSVPPGAARVRILSDKQYVVGPSRSDTQFGVVNNLLGTRAFVPIVRRTERLNALLAENLSGKVTQAMAMIEPEVLARAVDYLYLAETRSTYGIEQEIPDNQRAAKFRRLLEEAGAPGRLTEEQLTDWQHQIVNPLTAEGGFRGGQNWLSRAGRLRNIADYIPPPPALVSSMMKGVAEVAAWGATNQVDPVVAASCASFGLVFVHPFYDGNGRLHRFLIHHVLRQSGFTPKGIVLPISARMLKNVARYSDLLKSYSRPRTALLDYRLDADSDTIHVRTGQPAWLYASFDATAICEFVLECCKQCVEQDLALEVRYLHAYDAAVARLETWLDLRQSKMANLVDIVVQGHGELSKRKRAHFAELTDEDVERAEKAIAEEFAHYLDAVQAAAPDN
ncbi:Fic family protein [Paraburkholderia humisilvae]|uniref:Fido domain-containing protein n=1 Tax=Paraburkholderia humisilvae TaxID=627669 RepID=A0A6J5DQL6_9BURK|nr:Fic family protein [Paraburkholderia humisilvae]CAB3755225.1 hypothetical protein LMG29542_02535 [Paraburkholderia humisilvae]